MSPNNKKRPAQRSHFSFDVLGSRRRRLLAAFVMGAAGCVTYVFAAEDSAKPLPEIRFEGYPNSPPVSVVSRKADLFFYPCDQCHAAMEPNPDIRELNVMHVAELQHGRGRIWCLSCHDLENRNYLRTLLDEPVDFDQAHLVCGGCHSNRHKDWVFGAHGKRVANWQGERKLYDCAHCHDPHSPSIQPRAPKPPPPVRVGLELVRGASHERDSGVDRKEAED